MRIFFAVCSAVAACACAGPHSNGALWALQNVDKERVEFQVSDAQRAEQQRAFELGLADEALAGEQQRITLQLQTCPGVQTQLAVSPGDTVRDTIRLRAGSDSSRLAEVARVALADWYVRRASATQSALLCDQAKAALSRVGNGVEPSSSQLLNGLPAASVARRRDQVVAVLDTDPPLDALSKYAMGYVDTVHAAAPLPQYLALVYGGVLLLPSDSPRGLDEATAAAMVDREASAFRDWEPDALYAALRGAQT